MLDKTIYISLEIYLSKRRRWNRIVIDKRLTFLWNLMAFMSDDQEHTNLVLDGDLFKWNICREWIKLSQYLYTLHTNDFKKTPCWSTELELKAQWDPLSAQCLLSLNGIFGTPVIRQLMEREVEKPAVKALVWSNPQNNMLTGFRK